MSTRKDRDLVDILDEHEREIRKLKQALVRAATAASGGLTDHGALTGLGDDDHTHYWNDARGDAKIATHDAIADAHHARYTDGEAVAAVGTPWVALIAAEDHHTKYTDGEAVSAMGALANSNPLNHSRYTDAEADARAALQDHDHATPIAAHAADVDAHHSRYTDTEADARVTLHAALPDVHHSRYTDAEAAAKIAADDLYVKNAGDGMTGDLYMGGNEIQSAILKHWYLGSAPVVGDADDGQDAGVTFYYGSSGTTNKAPGTDHAYMTLAHSSSWAVQKATDWRTNKWYSREKNSGTWGAWEEFAYVSYVDAQDHDHATPIAAHAAVSDAHHARYLDSEAVSAMGTKSDANTLNHDRYTDAEAIAAVGTVMEGVPSGAALPTSGMIEGSLFFLTTDKKLYRYDGSNWISTVPVTDLTGQITAAQITAGTITANEIATNTITAGQIAAGAIEASELAVGAVTASAILAGTITTDKMTAGTINADRLTAGSITTGLMTADSIDGDRIAAGTLDADKITANSITAGQIAADAIEAGEIATGAVTADAILAGAVTTAAMTAGTINADRLTAGSITTGLMTAGTIDADRLTALSIEAGQIASGAITAGKIDVANLGAIKANLGTVTVDDSLTMTSGGVFSTAAAAPRWIFDIDNFGDQDFIFESGLPHEYAKGGLMAELINVPTTWEQGGVEIVSPTLGDVTNRNYAHSLVHSDYVNKKSNGYVRAWAWGNHGAEATIGAQTYGSGNGILNLYAVAGTGYGIIYVNTDTMEFLSGQIQATGGTGTAPGYGFSGDTNTGMRLYSSDVLGFQAGGTTALTISATSGGFLTTEVLLANNEIQVGDGAKGDPSMTFFNDGDLGFRRATTNEMYVQSGGGKDIVLFGGATSTGATGTRGIGALRVLTNNDYSLSSTSGTRLGAQTWQWSAIGNTVALEVEAVRDSTGSDWVSAAVGFRRITDGTSQASLWFYQSRVGINMSGPTKTLQAAGTFACRPRTGSGFDAHFINAGGSEYEISRVTSARKYKTDEQDARHLADIKLKPVSFLFQPEDGDEEIEYDPIREYGFIADDIADQDDLLGVYFEDEIENYSTRGVLAVLAAKANRAERERDEAKAEMRKMKDRLTRLETLIASLV